MQINRCPKCGREPRTVLLGRFTDRGKEYIGIGMSCIICDIKTKPCKKRAEAVAKWNEMTKEKKELN
jgi:hypothetical protein